MTLMEVELDLLNKFKEICREHDLNWFAGGGTLLGTIRHQGFIPWDDDIDLYMMWPDYQKLMEIASKELEYPYYYQCIYTEPNCMPSACRLRRSDTTGFTEWEYHNMGPAYDKGIFIDIFPLFNVPDSDEDKAKQKERVIFYYEAIHAFDALNQRIRGKEVNPRWEAYIPTLMKCCGTTDVDRIDIVDLKKKYYDACAMFEDVRTKEVGVTSSRCFYPNWMWDTAWFDDHVEKPFENTTVRCPAQFEKVLERLYGADWRTPIQGGSAHEMMAVSTTTPWKDFDFSQFGQN